MFDSAALVRKDQKRLSGEGISETLHGWLTQYLTDTQSRKEEVSFAQ